MHRKDRARANEFVSTPEGLERQRQCIEAANAIVDAEKLNLLELAEKLGVSYDTFSNMMDPNNPFGQPRDGCPAILEAEAKLRDWHWLLIVSVNGFTFDPEDLATGQGKLITFARRQVFEIECRAKRVGLTNVKDSFSQIIVDLAVRAALASGMADDVPEVWCLRSNVATTFNIILGWILEQSGSRPIDRTVTSQLRSFMRLELAALRLVLRRPASATDDQAWAAQGIGHAEAVLSRSNILLGKHNEAVGAFRTLLEWAKQYPEPKWCHVLHSMSVVDEMLVRGSALAEPLAGEFFDTLKHDKSPSVREAFVHWCKILTGKKRMKSLFTIWKGQGKKLPLLALLAVLISGTFANSAFASGDSGGVRSTNGVTAVLMHPQN